MANSVHVKVYLVLGSVPHLLLEVFSFGMLWPLGTGPWSWAVSLDLNIKVKYVGKPCWALSNFGRVESMITYASTSVGSGVVAGKGPPTHVWSGFAMTIIVLTTGLRPETSRPSIVGSVSSWIRTRNIKMWPGAKIMVEDGPRGIDGAYLAPSFSIIFAPCHIPLRLL